VGLIARYFVEKYGFRPGTPVFAFTGDNPSSLVGMGATSPGVAVVSLGTSDTVFAAMPQPRTDPRGYGHVFGNPAGGFMSLICFTNGSLARERVAEELGLGWDDFSRAILDRTAPGNDGNFVLPYFTAETTPHLSKPEARWFGDAEFVAKRRPEAAARAIVEAQALSMRHHSDWIGVEPDRLVVTGGASRNRGILQVLADVFQAEIQTLRVGNASALGGALRAAQGATGWPWEDFYAQFAAPDPELEVTANPAAKDAYAKLMPRFVAELDALLRSA
jgi:xylulokinase